jgi:hypothetical protein
MQNDAPTVVVYVPAEQFVHTFAPTTLEDVPTGHEMHTTEEVAPVAFEYVPDGHEMHTVEELPSTAVEYVPVGQLHVLALQL